MFQFLLTLSDRDRTGREVVFEYTDGDHYEIAADGCTHIEIPTTVRILPSYAMWKHPLRDQARGPVTVWDVGASQPRKIIWNM